MNQEFTETQKFRQWWLWLLLIGALLFQLFTMTNTVPLSMEFWNLVEVNPNLWLPFVLYGLVMILFISLKLNTKINESGIYISYFPFVKRKVRWEEIATCEIVDYEIWIGWGIRFFTQYGTVYNTQGTKGLAVKLKNGKKFMIGTQKADDLRDFLKELHS